MAVAHSDPVLGDGIYTFSEAAQILRTYDPTVSTRRLRYWVDTDLVPPTFEIKGVTALSFDDLVSLEVIRRFLGQGATLQRVRQFELALRHHYPAFRRPFAYKRFFTDGASVWVEEIDVSAPILVELVGRRRGHYAWTDAIQTFATDIRFDSPDEHATAWQLTPWVEVDPTVQAGAPVVRGTRLPARTVAANLKRGTAAEVADWYGLSVDQVEGVKAYFAVG